jgi:RNA polymerase sigma-70 factor (ECF subfamily)
MPTATERNNVVRPAAFQRDDSELVAAAVRGERAAQAQIFDRHASHVTRVLARMLGTEGELADLVHEVFVMALRDLSRLTEPSALKAWLTAIAVNVARGHIRKRTRRRWLRFFAPEDVPDAEAPTADDETREAARATYAVLDKMDAEERIPFALRFIDGMELTEVAAACGVSLATIKRRLARAEAAFVEGARDRAILEPWLKGGTRWSET